jgi:hypothetical protein
MSPAPKHRSEQNLDPPGELTHGSSANPVLRAASSCVDADERTLPDFWRFPPTEWKRSSESQAPYPSSAIFAFAGRFCRSCFGSIRRSRAGLTCARRPFQQRPTDCRPVERPSDVQLLVEDATRGGSLPACCGDRGQTPSRVFLRAHSPASIVPQPRRGGPWSDAE